MPILILHGDDDTNTPVADSLALAALGPSVEVRVLSGADHFFCVNGRRLEVEAMAAEWIYNQRQSYRTEKPTSLE